jgi:hypothetical protein
LLFLAFLALAWNGSAKSISDRSSDREGIRRPSSARARVELFADHGGAYMRVFPMMDAAPS